jgi:capsule polysaccharide export protein KpsE/RkpR
MEFAKLLHDYIKTLIWTFILLVVIFSYEKEVMGLLENREIDAFGLKIGARIKDFSTNYENELQELKAVIEQTPNNEALLTKIETIDQNATRELKQVQNASTNANLIKNRAVSTFAVAAAERAGFEAILERNVDVAISQFGSARKLWADYHNVSELEKVLQRKKSSLNNEASWLDLEELILQKYSWGMPNDIRERFKSSLLGSK